MPKSVVVDVVVEIVLVFVVAFDSCAILLVVEASIRSVDTY